MSKFKFLTTPEFHPQAKKAPFFKNTFVKECVSAKENLIERHKCLDKIKYIFFTNVIEHKSQVLV